MVAKQDINIVNYEKNNTTSNTNHRLRSSEAGANEVMIT